MTHAPFHLELKAQDDAARMHHYRLHHDPLSSHQQIASYVRKLNQSPILDVGSAQGMLGQLLQGTNLQIDAIEPNAASVEAARPYYNSIQQSDIESANLPRSHYKVVVCGDVLEHTTNPRAALIKLREAATPDATFIISLPNVAHISVRFLLMCGYFPKMERGILDRTHLHFFTRETASQMLNSAGLTVAKRLATAAPLSEIWPRGENTLLFSAAWHLQHMALVLFRGLFAYQWILIARPTEQNNPIVS